MGREGELARLETLLAQAVGGRGAVVFITGESGIGKTALAREFLRRVRPHDPPLSVARGRCAEQYGVGEAYLPFLEAAGKLLLGPGRERTLFLLRRYAPTACLQLPSALDADSEGLLRRQTVGATKERMLRETGDFIEASANEAPVVLLLEDLHWADASSVDLLRYLANRLARQRVLVLGIVRPAQLEANPPLKGCMVDLRALGHCHEIALGPLGPGPVAAYLDARFAPHRLPDRLAVLLHARTEGHPLFVRSLVEFLVESGEIALGEGGWTLAHPLSEAAFEAPQGVRDMIRRKLDTLDPEDRRVLQYASVMGKEFLSPVAARLVETAELALEERLDRLDRVHRLIDTRGEEELPDGLLATRYRFAHSLYQEVLYDDLVSKLRVLLHRQVGEQLLAHYGAEAPRIAGVLALHFERGRDFAAAVRFLAHSGDNAARLYAYGEALDHYSHALQLLERLPASEQVEPTIALGEKRGMVSHALGRFDDAVRDYRLAAEQARAAGSPGQECAALTGLCNALFFARRIEEMAIEACAALDAAARSASEARRIEASLQVALILQDSGNLAESKPLLDEIVAAARRLSHRSALMAGLVQRAALHYWHSEYALTEERVLEALPLASELGEGFWLLASFTFLGLARGNLGRMSDALDTFAEAIDRARRNGDRFWLPRLLSHVGWIHRELLDHERAITSDEEGLRVAREQKALWAPEADALLNLLVDQAHFRREKDMRKVLAELEAVSAQETWFAWLYEIRLLLALTDHWFLRGDLEQSETHAQRLLETATRHEARTYVIDAHRALAEVALARGDTAGAGAHLDVAVSLLRRRQEPLTAWKTHAAVGRLRARMGDGEGARSACAEAGAVVHGIAESVRDEALRARFLGAPAVREILRCAGAEAPSH